MRQLSFAAVLVLGIGFALAGPAAAVPKPARAATPVAVNPGRTTSDINAVLDPGGSISGRLVDKDTGGPVTDMALIAIVSRFGVGSADVYSGPDGRFTIAGLPPSSTGYVVCAYNEVDDFDTSDYAPQCFPHTFFNPADFTAPLGATQIPLGVDEDKDIGEIALTRGGRIGGVVSAPSGRALRRVGVTARSLSDAYLTFDSNGGTNGKGTYFVDALPPSPRGWEVCFDGETATTSGLHDTTHGFLTQCYRHKSWHGGALPAKANPVHVAAGDTRSGIDARLRIAGSVSGLVTDARTGAPLRGAAVTIYGASGHASSYAQTNRHGRYTADGLHARHNYRVCAETSPQPKAPAGYLGGCAHNVVVRGGRTTAGVHLALPRAASIAGIVRSAANGTGVRRADLSAFDVAGHQIGVATSDAHGRYLITGLRASAKGYLVCATDFRDARSSASRNAPACAGHQAWDGAPKSLPQTPRRVVLATRQHKRGVDISLPAAGAISGSVTSRVTGHGLFDFDIDVYDPAGNPLIRTASDFDTGAYTLSGLAPSTAGYTVCFSGNAYRIAQGSNEDGPFVGQCYNDVTWPH
jgi:hypothetical protein